TKATKKNQYEPFFFVSSYLRVFVSDSPRPQAHLTLMYPSSVPLNAEMNPSPPSAENARATGVMTFSRFPVAPAKRPVPPITASLIVPGATDPGGVRHSVPSLCIRIS